MLENASSQFHIQTSTFSNTESSNLDFLTMYLNLSQHEIRQVKFSKTVKAKDVRFFLLAATLTILVSGFADCFAQDSSTGARNFSCCRGTHLSQPAKTAAQRFSSTSSPTRDAQAVSLANQALPALTSGVAITDATVQGTSDFIGGWDQENGNATLEGQPDHESKVVFALNAGWRSEVQNRSATPPPDKGTGADTLWHSVPVHSCWTGVNLPLAADFKAPAVDASSLPSAPEPKIRPEGEPVTLRLAAQPFLPVKLAPWPRETPQQRKIWYGLMVAGHSAAAFDAWTTRRAVDTGDDHEANPSLRPFANSKAIYAAMQAGPAYLDFLGKRMMVGQSPWIRKLWWVPQVAGASLSFRAGVHNMKLRDDTQ